MLGQLIAQVAQLRLREIHTQQQHHRVLQLPGHHKHLDPAERSLQVQVVAGGPLLDPPLSEPAVLKRLLGTEALLGVRLHEVEKQVLQNAAYSVGQLQLSFLQRHPLVPCLALSQREGFGRALEQNVDGHPERPHVARRSIFVGEHLRRGVVRRGYKVAKYASLAVVFGEEAGAPEVAQLEMALVGKEHVLWLDVAVRQSERVQVLHCFECLLHQISYVILGEVALPRRNVVVQVPALAVLHHHVEVLGVFVHSLQAHHKVVPVHAPEGVCVGLHLDGRGDAFGPGGQHAFLEGLERHLVTRLLVSHKLDGTPLAHAQNLCHHARVVPILHFLERSDERTEHWICDAFEKHHAVHHGRVAHGLRAALLAETSPHEAPLATVQSTCKC
mmetsp:Transcript_5339/g.10179  ORF Transcript_5339/g.10179 Transcript_5339/m.10179 type:complete len:387 (+) Transcript_5339:796-1956(+)